MEAMRREMCVTESYRYVKTGIVMLQNGGYASRDVRYRELQVCENRYCNVVSLAGFSTVVLL